MEKYAILIGISNYFDVDSFPTISCCQKDINEIYHKMIDPNLMNYQPVNITMMHDRVKEDYLLPLEGQIEWILNEISSKTTSQDTFLFYFSGHGCVKNEQAYLVAKDTRWESIGSKDRGISFLDIKNILKQSKAAQKIAIIDACHSGEGLSKARESLEDEKFHDALQELSRGIAVLSSCEKGQKSWALKNQSIFTKYLLDGLSRKAIDNMGNVTLFSLSQYVGINVEKWAQGQKPPRKQIPTFYGTMQAKGFVLVPSIEQPQELKIEPSETRVFVEKTLEFPMKKISSYGSVIVRPLLPVKIFSIDRQNFMMVSALIDTGADKNCIPLSIIEALGIDFGKGMNYEVATLTGKHTMTEYDVEIEIGNLIIKTTILAAENIQQIILGSNFLRNFEITLDYEKEKVILKKLK